MYQLLGINGFSVEDARDCAPQRTTEEFQAWIAWQDGFSLAQQQHSIPLTSAIQALCAQKTSYIYTNSFVTFLSWIYWLGTHAFNAAGHMGALL
jgi:hypothetical protein